MRSIFPRRWIMPQRIICENCGSVLYSGMELKPPDEVSQQYAGKCPHCGKKLVFRPEKVDIKVLE